MHNNNSGSMIKKMEKIVDVFQLYLRCREVFSGFFYSQPFKYQRRSVQRRILNRIFNKHVRSWHWHPSQPLQSSHRISVLSNGWLLAKINAYCVTRWCLTRFTEHGSAPAFQRGTRHVSLCFGSFWGVN